MNNLTLKIGRDGTLYEYSELFTKATIGGRKGAAPRNINMTIADVEALARANINCGNGQECYLYLDGNEIFRGLLMSDGRNDQHTIPIQAYDECVRLSNNKDSFSYTDKTATYIFKDCLQRLGLSLGGADETGYRIGELVKKATTYWDVIQDAMSQTYKATGVRFYVYSSKGKIYLKKRTASKTMPVLSQDSNIVTYDYNRSIYDTRTRLQLTTSKGNKKGSTVNSALEKKIGRFQDVQSVDEDISQSDINQRINIFNWEKGIVAQTLKVTAIGDISCVAGACVYVDIPEAGVKRVMYIDEDKHTFENGKHTMSLTLSYESTEDKKVTVSAPKKKDYKVGDIVRFNGGYHYVSSDAKNPTGSKCAAGNAKITSINKKSWAKHPYHLIHTDSSSRVYGWVDEGTFS